MFDKFGWVNSIDKLANHDVTQWLAALNVSFSYGITKLELEVERGEFNKRYAEVIKNKEPVGK